MKLRIRIPLLVGLSLFLWIGAIILISQLFVLGGFRRLEIDDARTNVLRAGSEIDAALAKLASTAGDWAMWDDAYQFIQDANPEFVEDNLQPQTAVNLEAGFIVLLNPQGQVMHAVFVDLEKAAGLPLRQEALARLAELGPPAVEAPEGRTGIVALPEGPAMTASRQILRSDRSGPPRGWLLLGRYLDQRELQRIQDKLQLPVSLLPPGAWPGPSEGPGASAEIPITVQTDGQLAGYKTFADVRGSEAFTLRVLLPRRIYRQGLATLLYFYGALTALGVLFMGLLVLLLSRSLLRPLSRMSRSIEQLPGHAPGPIGFQPRADELGVLGGAIDGMLLQIQQNRKKLQEQAYSLGKAEMASEVLHSIRNALTPLVGELELLSAASGTQSWRKELRRIGERTAKIEQLLDSQERWAHGPRIGEPVRLEELLQDAFLSLEGGHRELLELEWRKHPGSLAIATANRIALLQVFAILLSNAAESIHRQGRKRGTVRLDFEQAGAGPDSHVVVALQDDGAGIRPEHLEQLFVSGFTTKHQSSSGVGLHWCANTLHAMRGGIVAESAGPGRGACFRVTLALQEES